MKNIARVSIILLLALAACEQAPPSNAQPGTVPETEPVVDPGFESRLLEIAREYEWYGRVDDLIRFAPYLCGMPSPGVGRFSRSTHRATHGDKLYYLFASKRDEYMKLSAGNHADQVLVKEAWHPKKRRGKPTPFDLDPVHLRPMAKRGDEYFEVGQKRGLFIMYRLDPRTENTDDGWVYGTVEDGQVTSAGRVASCMSCHQAAPHGRLFGLPADH